MRVAYLFIAALIGVLLIIPTANAGDCRRVVTTYSQPYYATSYDYNQYAVVVAKAVPVYLNLNSYTSVAEVARDYFSTKQATKEGFLEAMRELQSNAAPAPPAAGPAAPSPPSTGTTSLAPKIYGDIKSILAARCVQCHSPKDSARVDLSVDPEKISGKTARDGALKCAIGSMPKKGPVLPDQELNIIASWADQKPRD